MTEDLLLILLITVVLVSLWFFILGPRVEEARAERARLAAEKRAAEEARRKKLREERDHLLKSIRAKAPNYILQARLEFEREYRSRGGEGMFGQEMSPLVCFGYRVGKTNGRTETERRAILEYAIAADYGATLPFLPAEYRNEWGSSLSITRFQRIFQHLNNMADLREGRPNYDVAIAHWRADAAWLQDKQWPQVEKFHEI